MSQRPEIESQEYKNRISSGLLWALENLNNNRRRITDLVLDDEIPKNLSKGWIVDFSDVDIFKKVKSALYLLQPDDKLWTVRDNFRASQQMKAWEKELGGPVVHLLVPDTEQKDVPWLAQPVRRDWLTEYPPEAVLLMYTIATEDNPNRLRYRAAVIARTGQTPETLLKK